MKKQAQRKKRVHRKKHLSSKLILVQIGVLIVVASFFLYLQQESDTSLRGSAIENLVKPQLAASASLSAQVIAGPTNRPSQPVTRGYIVQLKEDPAGAGEVDVSNNLVGNAYRVRRADQPVEQPKTQQEVIEQRQVVEAEQEDVKEIIAETLEEVNEEHEQPSLLSIVTSPFVPDEEVSIEDLPIVEEFTDSINAIVLEITPEEAEAIEELPEVEAVYPDTQLYIVLHDSLPLVNAPDVWLMDEDGNDCQTSGKDCITGKNVTIGIIDTGVDYDHPDLCAKASEPTEITGAVVGVQGAQAINSRPPITAAMVTDENNAKWLVRYDSQTSRTTSIVGSSISSADLGVPQVTVSTVERAGDLFLFSAKDDLGINPNSLRMVDTNSGPKMHVSHQQGLHQITYQQVHQGLPVFTSYVSVGFINNRFVSYSSNYFDVPSINTQPDFDFEKAHQLLHLNTFAPPLQDRTRPPPIELGILPDQGEFLLTYKIELDHSFHALPDHTVYLDAQTGQIVKKIDNRIYQVDGTITGNIFPEDPSEGAVERVFAHNDILGWDEEQETSDEQGQYQLTQASESGEVNLHASLSGPWVRVESSSIMPLISPLIIDDSVSPRELYWSDPRQEKLFHAHADGTNKKELLSARIPSFALDNAQNEIYFADRYSALRKMPKQGGEVQTIQESHISESYDVHLDKTNRKLYWTDYTLGTIKRSNLDGSNTESIFAPGTLNGPIGIWVDETNNLMYWTDYSDAIFRATTQGEQMTQIGTDYGAFYVAGTQDKLYWTNSPQGEIKRSNFDGSNVQTIVKDDQALHSITIDGTTMLWSGENTIKQANLDGTSEETLIEGHYSVGIGLSSTHIYWANYQEDRLYRSKRDGTEITQLVPSVNQITGVAVDEAEDKVYWSSIDGALERSDLNGENREELQTFFSVDYVAIDEVNQKLYWISDDTIMRSNVDGSGQETIADGESYPYSMSLHPTQGKIYWTNYFDREIKSANLDGTNEQVILTLSASHYPSDLTIDTVNDRMYWYEGATDQIGRASLDGSGVEYVVSGGYYITDISLDPEENALYWSEEDELFRASLDGTNIQQITIENGEESTQHRAQLQSPTTHDWNWDADDQSDRNEESNVFYHTNIVHDFFNDLGVTENDLQYVANVNIQATCNAHYTAHTINFYQESERCENTALLSDVIYHEYVHGVVDDIITVDFPYWDETGNLNEAWADYFAVSMNDNSCLAEGFYKGEDCLRDCENTNRWPEDYGAEPHTGSPIICGSLWDARQSLGASVVDQLVIQAMRLQPTTFAEFLERMLVADDDNGDLNDGTPHLAEICEAFSDNHGVESVYCDDDLPQDPPAGECYACEDCKVAGGYDYVNDDTDPMDDNGHGTHVAGTAAGKGDYNKNNVYDPGLNEVWGVAPDAKIYAYKVCDASGGCWQSDIIAAIEKSMDPNNDGNYDDHLDIISLSLGGFGDPDDASSQALDTAVENGVIAVASAGNSGPYEKSIGSPGAARKAITVGASSKNDEVASFSSRGPVEWLTSDEERLYMIKPDIVAPGVNICAAQWQNAWSDFECIDNEHTSISGTSMSAPHVSGAAALLVQKYPSWTPTEVKLALRGSSVDIEESIFVQGYGRMDINATANRTARPGTALLAITGDQSDVMDVRGTANGEDFSKYTLYLGVGSQPDQTGWTELTSSTQPKTDDILLSNLDLTPMDEDYNFLRLVVENTAGETIEDRSIINVNRLEVAQPLSNDIYRAGDTISIKGKTHVTYESLVVEWMQNGGDWSSAGITLDSGSDTFASWDTTGLSTGIYQLRVTLMKTIGGVLKDWSSKIVEDIALDETLRPGWPQYVEFEQVERGAVTTAEYHTLLPTSREPSSSSLQVVRTQDIGIQKDDRYYIANTISYWAGYLEPLVIDLDADGDKEIVVVSGGHPPKVRVYNDNGDLVWIKGIGQGDVAGGNLPHPIAADIDNDGFMEIVSYNFNEGGHSKVVVLNHDGTLLWESQVTQDLHPTLSIADLDNDGFNQIIIKGNDYREEQLVILDHQGVVQQQWPLEDSTWTGSVLASPSIGNFDDDSDLEIVIIMPSEKAGRDDDTGEWINEAVITVYNLDGTVVNGWPITLPGSISSSPVVGDIDNDGLEDIVVGLIFAGSVPHPTDGGVYAFDRSGNILSGFPFEKGWNFWSTPALHDIDQDGDLEISASRLGFFTYLLHHDGSVEPGWPQFTWWNDYYSSIMVDSTGDGKVNILTTAGNGFYPTPSDHAGVFGWEQNGVDVNLFPKRTESDAQAPSVVQDIDNDGTLELMASSNWDYDPIANSFKRRGTLYVWNLETTYDDSSLPWPMYKQNPQHTGRYPGGLVQKTTNEISILPEDNNAYGLKYKDHRGNQAAFNFTFVNGSEMTLGDEEFNQLIHQESKPITKLDYFILSDSSYEHGERPSYVFKYNSSLRIDTDDAIILFEDLVTGQETLRPVLDYGQTETTHFGVEVHHISEIRIGGTNYKVYTTDPSVDDFEMYIDLDGDGVLSDNHLSINTEYGAEISFEDVGDTIDVSVDSPQHTGITQALFRISEESGDAVLDIHPSSALDYIVTENPDVVQAVTDYGAVVTVDSSEDQSSVLIEYPQPPIQISDSSFIIRNDQGIPIGEFTVNGNLVIPGEVFTNHVGGIENSAFVVGDEDDYVYFSNNGNLFLTGDLVQEADLDIEDDLFGFVIDDDDETMVYIDEENGDLLLVGQVMIRSSDDPIEEE